MSTPHLSYRRLGLWFLAALVLLVALGAVVGLDDVVAALARADLGVTLGALLATACWLSLWGLSLRISLRTLGVSISPSRAVLVYTSAAALNSITPFAQMGGEALSAGIIARSTDAEYETGLAAMTAVDVVNLVPTPVIAFVGVTWLVVTGAGSALLTTVAWSLLGVALVGAVAAGVTWRYRVGFGRSLVRTVVGTVAAANRVIGHTVAVDLPGLAHRVESYLLGVVRVFRERRGLGASLVLSALGWIALVVAFWLSLLAVGHPIPVAIAAVVLPVGMLAIAVPLPGGVGGVEAAFVALLVGLGGVPLVTATAGVLVYRGATYWAPLLAGGLVTAMLSMEQDRA